MTPDVKCPVPVSSSLLCLLKPLLNLQVVFRFCHPAVSWYCKASVIPMSQNCAVELLRVVLARSCLQQNLSWFLLPLALTNRWFEPVQTKHISRLSHSFSSFFFSSHFLYSLEHGGFRLEFKTIHGCTHSTSRQRLFVHIYRSRKKSSIFQKFLPLPLPCLCL